MKRICLILGTFMVLIFPTKGQPIIVYNNNLIYVSKDSITKANSLGKYDGNTAALCPNPNNGPGYQGSSIICNNNLYYCYMTDSVKSTVASFNGISTTIWPLPDSIFYIGSPVIYKNKLMGIFTYKTSNSGMASDSLGDKLVTNGYDGSPIIFNDVLYFSYSAGQKSNLAKYDGTTTTIINNPDTGSGFQGSPIIHKNGLYFVYKNSHSIFQLAKLESNAVKLIPNPDTGIGVTGNLLEFNNELYLRYSNNANKSQLAKFNGAGLTLISNPDTGIGYYSRPVVISSNLFFTYIDTSGVLRIGKYDGSSINLISNPDAGSGITIANILLAYQGNLYFGYRDATLIYRLAKCDGNSITLLANPDAGSGYKDYPVIYNDKLYFMYSTVNTLLKLAECDGSSIKIIPGTYLGGKVLKCKICPPDPSTHETGPYTQSLSNIIEFKTTGLRGTMIAASVYPNPSNTSVKIISSQLPSTVQIVDISGKIILQTTSFSSETSINISDLNDGLYFIYIQSEKGMVVEKFIKK